MRAESIREKTKIPDSHEAFRQHMQEETTQELRFLQRHRELLATAGVVLPTKGDVVGFQSFKRGKQKVLRSQSAARTLASKSEN